VSGVDWKRVEAIFAAALARQAPDRTAYIRAASGGDYRLESEVTTLLKAHTDAEEKGFSFQMENESDAQLLNALHSEFLVGQMLGRFMVEEYLGAGGMGIVYRAMDTESGHPVAIKLLSGAAVEEERRRLQREADAMRRLHHRNIVAVEGLYREGDVDFLVMEYVRGDSLAVLLSHGPLPLARCLAIASECAAALAAAHEAGIIHRDLKPANIMITPAGEARLLDFGVCRVTAGDAPRNASLTAAGGPVGTASYMAPEQADGRPIDAGADIFALGAVLYEMLAGRRAFDGPTRVATIAQVLRDAPKPLPHSVPAAVNRLVNRCLEKDPSQRYQSAASLARELDFLSDKAANGKLRGRSRLRIKAAGMAAAGIFVAAAAVSIPWAFKRSGTNSSISTAPVRVTYDTGLTTSPAISGDGKLIAYASDRSGEGHLDVWVQRVGASEAIRLTRGLADNYDPSFSPDGRTIAFRSERNGGGIYLVSALGGEERMIVARGRRPRFSPDGLWIAYWIGNGTPGFLSPGSGKIYFVPSAGGVSRELVPEFAAASFPIWTPDSRAVLFLANRDPKLVAEPVGKLPPGFDSVDWWIAPIDGGAPKPTGANRAFRDLGFALLSQVPGAWTSGSDAVLMSGSFAGDTTNVWLVPISSKTWKLSAPPRRLTFGTTPETEPVFGGGNEVVFAGVNENLNVWSLPIDANRAKPSGALQRLTNDTLAQFYPCISPEGKKLAFSSRRSGNRDIWLKDLATGKETNLTNRPEPNYAPSFSPDSMALVYRAVEKQKSVSYVLRLDRSLPERVRICEGCFPGGWSSDGKRILIGERGVISRVWSLDIASGERAELVNHTAETLDNTYFSADDRWITFNAFKGGSSKIFVAPVSSSGVVPESGWISIADTGVDDKPRWSPDGNLLYFISERDGFRCVWAQRLNSGKHPLGTAIPILHAHEARRSLMNVGWGELRMSVARDKIVFNMSERTGNIWMLKIDQN
jgi:serine/threonine protein kinase